jgi:hypothetical protein
METLDTDDIVYLSGTTTATITNSTSVGVCTDYGILDSSVGLIWGTYYDSGTNEFVEVREYVDFLTEITDLDIPSYDNFKGMSVEEKKICSRDLKIDRILK